MNTLSNKSRILLTFCLSVYIHLHMRKTAFNLRFEESLLQRLDEYAREHGTTRTGVLTHLTKSLLAGDLALKPPESSVLLFSEDDARLIRERLAQRFTERTAQGCHVRPEPFSGLPRFNWDRQQHSAHRVAYTVWKGPIPEGQVLTHLCGNLQCVNPSHLSLRNRLANPLHTMAFPAESIEE